MLGFLLAAAATDRIVEAVAAGAVLAVVGMFLKFLVGERKERRAAAEASRVAHEKRDEAFERVVERNTEMLGQTKEAIGANTAMLMKIPNGRVGA